MFSSVSLLAAIVFVYIFLPVQFSKVVFSFNLPIKKLGTELSSQLAQFYIPILAPIGIALIFLSSF